MSLAGLRDPLVGGSIDGFLNSLVVGDLDVVGDGSIQVATITTNNVIINNDNPSGTLEFDNGTAAAQKYKWYAANTSGGGLVAGNLQLYSYNNSSNSIAPVLDITPQNDANAPATTVYGNLDVNNDGVALLSVTPNIVSVLNGVSVSKTGSNCVIDAINSQFNTYNNLQIRAAQYFNSFALQFDSAALLTQQFNCLLYVTLIPPASGGTFQTLGISGVGNLLPIGTTLNICLSQASANTQTLQVIYDSPSILLNLTSADYNKVFTLVKVADNNASTDWVKLTPG
jgi:hypothetical protein